MRAWAYLKRSSAVRTSASRMCRARGGRFASADALLAGGLTRVRAASRSVDASMGDTMLPRPSARANPLSADAPAGREAEVQGPPTQPASSDAWSPPHPSISAATALTAAVLLLHTPTIPPPHTSSAGRRTQLV